VVAALRRRRVTKNIASKKNRPAKPGGFLFESGDLQRFRAKRRPVRVTKTRQNKSWSPVLINPNR
jgi:hypothetical protein